MCTNLKKQSFKLKLRIKYIMESVPKGKENSYINIRESIF